MTFITKHTILNAPKVLDPPMPKARREEQNTRMVNNYSQSDGFIDSSAASNMDELTSITSERAYCLRAASRMLLLF